MATTYYAWTNIAIDVNEWGKVTKSAQTGDKVTASSLGVDEEQFKELVEAGSVRTTQYPDMAGFNGSPVEYRKAQLARAAAGEIYWPADTTVAEEETAVPTEKTSTPSK